MFLEIQFDFLIWIAFLAQIDHFFWLAFLSDEINQIKTKKIFCAFRKRKRKEFRSQFLPPILCTFVGVLCNLILEWSHTSYIYCRSELWDITAHLDTADIQWSLPNRSFVLPINPKLHVPFTDVNVRCYSSFLFVYWSCFFCYFIFFFVLVVC